MKRPEPFKIELQCQVAPPAGAWIETLHEFQTRRLALVAPPAGAWIETISLPQCGHKSLVAPPAGAWIETARLMRLLILIPSRAPRGRVD